ncbi:hypothetical protein F8388_020153 [Cannabis sativa]|uniref:Transposase MuDR plant domain-containing protein n=1 Tax=Cannabis sativa TaxID=3483 RepID=A0A7J6FIW6_CANSA|nr:hypothetical protein F8388_020153 [Cannabis sativa]
MQEKKLSEDYVKDLSSDLQIHNLLNLNRNLVSINILFDVNMGTSKGMKIESDMDLEAYLIENNIKEDLRNCPLIVEVIEKNQTMALSRTTSIAATTSASNATSRKKTAASSSAYSGTNSTSSRASCMATEGGQEVQSPLTILPSMGIEDLRVNHMFKNKEELKSALSRIAIKKHFQYKVKRSCSLTFWAKCIDENCEWYLRARSSKTSSYFRVIKYKNFHSCSLNHKSTDNRQASAKVISDCIKEKIRSVNPLSNKEDWNTPDEIKEDRIKPPEFKVKPGRPKKRRGEGIGDYARILALNDNYFLKAGGHLVISIKANCIDSTIPAEHVA